MARRSKTADEIRESHPRKFLRLEESALIPACRRLCAEWHNRIGACLTLDGDRLRGLLRRLLTEQIPEADVLAAIAAYAHELATDPWRQANPTARMDFAAFLQSGKFEKYMEAGIAQRDKAARQARHAAADRSIDQEKARIMQLAGSRFHALLAQAARETSCQASLPFEDTRVRARMLALLMPVPAVQPPASRGHAMNLWTWFRTRPNEEQRQYESDAIAELDRRPGGYGGVRSIASPAVREVIIARLATEVQHAGR